MPVNGLSVTAFHAISGVVVLPTNTMPSSRSRAATGESSCQGWSARTALEPRKVGQPRVRNMSLIEIGTPSSRPLLYPECQRCSEARAWASAASRSTRQNAFNSPSRSSMRSSTALVASTGDNSPARKAFTSSTAVISVGSTSTPWYVSQFFVHDVVQGPAGHPVAQVLLEYFHQCVPPAHEVPGIMRGDHHLGHVPQRVVFRQRLGIDHVPRRPCDRARVQRRDQVVGDDELSPAHVDHPGVWLHRGE